MANKIRNENKVERKKRSTCQLYQIRKHYINERNIRKKLNNVNIKKFYSLKKLSEKKIKHYSLSNQLEKAIMLTDSTNKFNLDLRDAVKNGLIEFLKYCKFCKFEIVSTGSHYDRTQVDQAVEFDFLLVVQDERYLKIIYHPETKDENASMCGIVMHTMFKPHFSEFKGPNYQDNAKKAFLSPKKFYAWFKKFLNSYIDRRWNRIKIDKNYQNIKIELMENNKGCPAVSFKVLKNNKCLFTMDFVPCFRLWEWPKPASTWASNWIPEAVVEAFKYDANPNIKQIRALKEKTDLVIPNNEFCYLVPKICEREKDLEEDHCKLWQICFGLVEKHIITHMNGYEQRGFCAKDVLRLCKLDVKEFNEKFKNNQGFDEKYMCSFYFKHTLFRCLENFPNLKKDWKKENWDECYKKCLRYFLECVEFGRLEHYFIPNVNLLEGKNLNRNMKQMILNFLKEKLENVDQNLNHYLSRLNNFY